MSFSFSFVARSRADAKALVTAEVKRNSNIPASVAAHVITAIDAFPNDGDVNKLFSVSAAGHMNATGAYAYDGVNTLQVEVKRVTVAVAPDDLGASDKPTDGTPA